MAVRAIRGATQVDADDREQVLEATRELVSAVLERNRLEHDDVISILFTATPDLVSEFPALAARELTRDGAASANAADERQRGGGMSGDFRGQITLDGPSGTGKSSVARDVARKLGAAYLDTGAMYRAATVAVLDAGVSLDDRIAVARAVAEAAIRVGTNARRELVTVDGVDVRERIRGAEVTRAVSPVSAVPAVRKLL